MADDGLLADEPQDALRTVELDDLLHVDAPSRLSLRVSPRALWRMALGLMIVGGVLALIASFAPWVIVQFTPSLTVMGYGPLPLNDPALTALLELIPKLWHGSHTLTWLIVSIAILIVEMAYEGLGAFIGMALCFRLRERVRRALLLTYAIWLATLLGRVLICTALLATDARSVFASIEHVSDGSLVSVAPAEGFWLAWMAALLGVVCLVLARYAVRRGLAKQLTKPAPRTTLELVSAGVATVGVIVWEVGFFTLPWVTHGCSGVHFSLNHFFTGTCSGLDSADMLSRWSATNPLTYAQYSAANPITALMGVVAIVMISAILLSMLVAAISICATALLWLGPQGAGRYGLPLLCLIASSFFALAAWQGAAVTLATTSAIDPWVYGPGVAVTFAGLTLAAVGLVSAITSRWRQARRG